MKILKPIETISTDQLLKLIENLFTLAFILGLVGGMSLVLLSISGGVTQRQKGYVGGFAAILLLLFLVFAARFIRNRIIPEIRNRCHRDWNGEALHMTFLQHIACPCGIIRTVIILAVARILLHPAQSFIFSTSSRLEVFLFTAIFLDILSRTAGIMTELSDEKTMKTLQI